MTIRILHGDCRALLPTLPAESVQCVVTSPPYFGLRDYGTAEWSGGDPGCDHKNDTRHQQQGASSQRIGRTNAEDQRNENFRGVCGKCGAVRIDGQIGAEVWTIATAPSSIGHFALMPPALADRCIRAGSRPGDMVLDPFAGAGTTGAEATRLGRDATLIDLNETYCRIADRRDAAVTPPLPYLEPGRKPTWAH
jgi:DNA modification methylase